MRLKRHKTIIGRKREICAKWSFIVNIKYLKYGRLCISTTLSILINYSYKSYLKHR